MTSSLTLSKSSETSYPGSGGSGAHKGHNLPSLKSKSAPRPASFAGAVPSVVPTKEKAPSASYQGNCCTPKTDRLAPKTLTRKTPPIQDGSPPHLSTSGGRDINPEDIVNILGVPNTLRSNPHKRDPNATSAGMA